MLVRDVMNLNAVRIALASTMRQAADLLCNTQTSDLMVVDDNGKFVGVLSEGDILRACMPSIESFNQSGGVAAAEDFEDAAKDLATAPIEKLIIKNVLTVKPGDKVIHAASLMVQKMIRRLPVVDQGVLVGTVSRAEVARGTLGR